MQDWGNMHGGYDRGRMQSWEGGRVEYGVSRGRSRSREPSDDRPHSRNDEVGTEWE